MAIRTGHGNGAGSPRVEVLPPDELPAGLPVDARDESPTDRGDRGKFADGNSLAASGGRARSGHTRLARKLRMGESFADPRFEPYAAAARGFRRAHVATLARAVGGGSLLSGVRQHHRQRSAPACRIAVRLRGAWSHGARLPARRALGG